MSRKKGQRGAEELVPDHPGFTGRDTTIDRLTVSTTVRGHFTVDGHSMVTACVPLRPTNPKREAHTGGFKSKRATSEVHRDEFIDNTGFEQ